MGNHNLKFPEKPYALLKDRFPHLAQFVDYIHEQENFDFEWIPVKNPIKGELDLLSTVTEETLYGRNNIKAFLRHWISHLPLQETDILYVYGLGLGYPFRVLKNWLAGNSARQIVFIEDDPEILYHSMFIEGIEELLEHKQVDILLLPKERHYYESFFHALIQRRIYRRFFVTGIPYYQVHKNTEFSLQRYMFDYCYYIRRIILGEYLDMGKDFYLNFWVNLPALAKSHPFDKFKDGLKNIPAIIVGAGPSLAKNVHLLEGIRDKALVIAGGTSVNVLNAYHLNPDLMVMLDPFESCFSRAIANTSFQTPLLYAPRLEHHALEAFSSPLIYINGSSSYQAETWIQKELGFSAEPIDLGTNVVNAAVKLASFMGCNPIITIGVDLAYTEKSAYGAEVKSHAITPESFKTRYNSEDIVSKEDIYGAPVNTLWKWINESYWYGSFYALHPELEFINCTEGGIGFSGVPNRPLSEVIQTKLTKSYDICGQLHALRENALIPVEDTTKILALRQEIYQNFKDIKQKLAVLFDKYPDLFKKTELSEEVEEEKAGLIFIEELKEEIAWKHILGEFDHVFTTFISYLDKEDRMTNPILEATSGRLGFLNRIVDFNNGYLEHVLENAFQEPYIAPVEAKSIPIQKKNKSCFCGLKGNVLSESSLVDGKREGPTHLWYQDGQRYADLNFKDNKHDGLQTYYYPSGQEQAQIPYAEGKLNGTVKLFWESGKERRTLTFVAGKREHSDIIWNEKGDKVIEAYYKDDVPIKQATQWNNRGEIVLQITYEEGKPVLEKRKNASGLLETITKSHQDSYIDEISQNTENLTDSLGIIVGSLGDALTAINSQTQVGLEIEDLKKQVEALKSLSSELTSLSVTQKLEENTEEHVKMEKTVKHDLHNLTHQMQMMLEEMNFQIESSKKKNNPDSGELP